MPRPTLTDITFVLDRSGSMESIKQATMEAFNGFVTSQESGTGEAWMTLVQFDDQYDVVYEAIPVAHAPPLTDATYQPRGSTALLDAMGRTIVATGERLRALPEDQRPGTVIFVTLTDGLENASRQYNLHRINELICQQRDVYSWQFVFLGANQDAIATAAQMGIGAGHAMSFSTTKGGTLGAYGSLDRHLHKVRKARASGDQCDIQFDADDRKAAGS